MGTRIRIRATWGEESVDVEARLNQTDTARAIEGSLPLSGTVQTWGEEIYFPVAIALPQENPQDEVEVGDLAYWPTGNAFCIFFGSTPASTGVKPKPASAVTVFGAICGNTTPLKRIPEGANIIVQKLT